MREDYGFRMLPPPSPVSSEAAAKDGTPGRTETLGLEKQFVDNKD